MKDSMTAHFMRVRKFEKEQREKAKAPKTVMMVTIPADRYAELIAKEFLADECLERKVTE